MKMTHYRKQTGLVTWIVAAILTLSALKSFAPPDQMELLLVGSGHKNIYAYWLNLTTAALIPTGEVAKVTAPSYIAFTPNRKLLYAISEGRTKDDSLVSAYGIESQTGKLNLLNQQLTGGAGPCYVEVDPSGRDVLVANYNSGSVAVFPIDAWGALGTNSAFVQDHGSSVNPQRQAGPHAHCIVTSPDDRFAFVCDLGLDKIMAFKFDPAKGSLEPNGLPFATVKPGEGPRHIAFHPNGKFAYVISEMTSSLTAYSYDSDRGILGQLQELSLLPADFKGENTGAEVAVHPLGKLVFASNRGEDSIVVFACNPDTGRLTFVERDSTGGKTPRHFEIDQTGAYLLAANQDSGTIVVFSIDQNTGHLRPTGTSAEVDTPMCVKCLGLTRGPGAAN
jgi:6-phosphogluconolactonase